MRALLVTIDGDGFTYRHRESGQSVGRVILDRVLTRYPFKFTVSFIAGELAGAAPGFDRELAARILALDNVEAASHSWSHPHDWRSSTVDLPREIDASVREIERSLLSGPKRVRSFLWTGRCNPSAGALARVHELGLANLNGRPFSRPWRRVGSYRQYTARARNDWDCMGLEEELMAGVGTPSVETFLARHEGDLGGFRSVIDDFEARAERPIHVYFHWYSGARADTLAALLHVLDWCAARPCAPMFVSEYVSSPAVASWSRLGGLRRAISKIAGAVGGSPSTSFDTLPTWWEPPHASSGGGGSDGLEGVRRSRFFDREGDLPAHGLARTVHSGEALAATASLRWEEHCVECAAPACYSVCDMFEAADHGCRRFEHGIEPAPDLAGAFGTAYRIVVRPWGTLLARVKRSVATHDGFLLKVLNPGGEPVPIVVDFRGPITRDRRRLLLKAELSPGPNQLYYPRELIERALPIRDLYEVVVAPETTDPRTELFVLVADFVRFRGEPPQPADVGRIKCVAFDLDDTLWQGILVEAGVAGIDVHQPVVDLVRTLQAAGVVTSIASRNAETDAVEALERLGLRDLFVYPKVNWGPKSKSLSDLASDLRIGIDAIALVDDSLHERLEVQAALPPVQVFEPAELPALCRAIVGVAGPPTAEARTRFESYRSDEARSAAAAAAGSDHISFLRSLGTTVTLEAPTVQDLDRVQELVQRTNQLNFSSHPYSREEIDAIVARPTRYRCLTVRAADRYGDYGLIGFGIVDVSAADVWTARDLMFSCRVLGRHIDEAVLAQILRAASRAGAGRVHAVFRSNGRNDSARQALEKVGFEPTGHGSYGFDLAARDIPSVDHIQVVDSGWTVPDAS